MDWDQRQGWIHEIMHKIKGRADTSPLQIFFTKYAIFGMEYFDQFRVTWTVCLSLQVQPCTLPLPIWYTKFSSNLGLQSCPWYYLETMTIISTSRRHHLWKYAAHFRKSSYLEEAELESIWRIKSVLTQIRTIGIDANGQYLKHMAERITCYFCQVMSVDYSFLLISKMNK